MAWIIGILVCLGLIGAIHEKYGAKGCLVSTGCLVLLFVVLVAMEKVSSYRKEYLSEKERLSQEEIARQEEASRIADARRIQEENKRIQEAKDEKIRSFALKNAPRVWAVYQSLQSEIDVQNEKIAELRKTLISFDKEPDQDMDYQRICTLRDEMIYSRKTLRIKLEDAYIASRKYEAAPSRKDYQELHKKALEDGIMEADAATEKFKGMRLNK